MVKCSGINQTCLMTPPIPLNMDVSFIEDLGFLSINGCSLSNLHPISISLTYERRSLALATLSDS